MAKLMLNSHILINKYENAAYLKSDASKFQGFGVAHPLWQWKAVFRFLSAPYNEKFQLVILILAS